jgi:hypothetical protein
VTEFDPRRDARVAAALEELAGWYAAGLTLAEEAGGAGHEPVAARPRGAGAGRIAWWTPVIAVAAALVVLLLLAPGLRVGAVDPAGPPLTPAALPGLPPTVAPPMPAPSAGLRARTGLALVAVGPVLAVLAGGALAARRRRGDGRRLAGVVLAAGGLLLFVALTWWTASPGNPNWAFLGRPGFGYSIVGVGVTVALVVVVVAGGVLAVGVPAGRVRAATDRRWPAIAGAALFVVAGLVVGYGHDVVIHARFRNDEPALVAAARAEADARSAGPAAPRCRPPVVPDLPPFLGRVDEVCVAPDGTVSFLRTSAGSERGQPVRVGIVWDPTGGVLVPGTCRRRVADEWYEFSTTVGPGCPANYSYTGG